MSYHAAYLLENPDRAVGGIDLATNSGLAVFYAWIDTLDPEDFPALYDLAEEGATEEMAEVAEELARALRKGGASVEVMGVGRRLLKAIAEAPEGAVAMAISDGVS